MEEVGGGGFELLSKVWSFLENSSASKIPHMVLRMTAGYEARM